MSIFLALCYIHIDVSVFTINVASVIHVVHKRVEKTCVNFNRELNIYHLQ